MSINLLVVEDDVSLLTEMRMELSDIEVQLHTESTEEGVKEYLTNNNPDLVIMDLYLNGNNSGHELSSLINSLEIPFIVITQHSIDFIYREVLKWRPNAFYSKPIDYFSLKYFIVKFLRSKNVDSKSSVLRTDGLYVRKRSSVIWLKFSDLLVVIGEGNYISLKSGDDKYVMRNSLVKFIQELPENMFLRVHRNYVVNIHKIQKADFQESTLLVGGIEVPIGRTYKSKLKSSIKV